MNRIIVNIRDDTDDERALKAVIGVIKSGRISANGESYCYVSEYADNTIVLAKRTKTADVFDVWVSPKIFESE